MLFSLPAAFTPTFSSNHIPRYEELYSEIAAHGVVQIVCLSVRDGCTMFRWGPHVGVKNVFRMPDGNGDFTQMMGTFLDQSSLGYGMH